MRNIYACFKWVIDEADIRIEGKSADFTRARWKIGDYDLNAIEAANQVKESLPGSEAIGLTVGDADAKASLKDALSRGLDAVWHINTGESKIEDHRTSSQALAAVLKQNANAALVICAEGSQDLFGRQTAPRIAAALNWPVVTSVAELSIQGSVLEATRKLEGCIEKVNVELPAVVSVLPSINAPEYPKLKAIMEAKKKPIFEVEISELELKDAQGLHSQDEGYVMNRKNIVIKEGSTEEKVAQLVESLKKDGVL
ncbi:MAG: electron transfer flavoprotein subunit beta/FixA family protein [Coriobacteriia bacterium]|nr:electron transfer flavoprotein subunit beta/FixA family protein [Coriobacteriia bacterium]